MSETTYTENTHGDVTPDSSDISNGSESDIVQQIRNVELRSDEVQEIMGYIPHWLIRWGITVIFLVIIFILTGSYFFKYPDIIDAQITLTTQSPPAGLMARTSGKIQALFVEDNQKVDKDQRIAVLESSSDYNHLFELKSQLTKMKPFFNRPDSPLPALHLPLDYVLGDLQSSYAGFVKSYDDYKHFFELGYYPKKIASTKDQVQRHIDVYDQMVRQSKLTEKDLDLAKRHHERNVKLYKSELISETDLDNSQSRYLQKQQALESARTSLSNTRIQISNLEQTAMDLELNMRQEINRLQSTLSQSYENLYGRITSWEQNYVLKSPVSGIVTFNQFWSVNQNVKSGERVVTVVPENGGEIIGKVEMPVMGSGKVKVGQLVNIKLVNYPHTDFGILKGKVKSISLVTTDKNMYSVEVSLPLGLKTSYDKELDFSQEMVGSAEIITEDVRLLERILKPLKTMLTKDSLDDEVEKLEAEVKEEEKKEAAKEKKTDAGKKDNVKKENLKKENLKKENLKKDNVEKDNEKKDKEKKTGK